MVLLVDLRYLSFKFPWSSLPFSHLLPNLCKRHGTKALVFKEGFQ